MRTKKNSNFSGNNNDNYTHCEHLFTPDVYKKLDQKLVNIGNSKIDKIQINYVSSY